jgi:hypothetical protein
MTLSIALNGTQIASGSIGVPEYGVWSADVSLTVATQIPSSPGGCMVTVGNLTLVGTAFRAASFAGAKSARIVGGFGGWRNPIAPRAYRNGGGVLLSMVLGDVAAEVGEQIQVASDGPLGTLFTREGSTAANPVPASRVLRQLGGPLWWVDPAGMTHVGPRPSAAVSSAFQAISYSGARGSFEIATEDPASWLPGATFSSDTITTTQTVSLLMIEASNDGVVRIRVLSSGEAVAA